MAKAYTIKIYTLQKRLCHRPAQYYTCALVFRSVLVNFLKVSLSLYPRPQPVYKLTASCCLKIYWSCVNAIKTISLVTLISPILFTHLHFIQDQDDILNKPQNIKIQERPPYHFLYMQYLITENVTTYYHLHRTFTIL